MKEDNPAANYLKGDNSIMSSAAQVGILCDWTNNSSYLL